MSTRGEFQVSIDNRFRGGFTLAGRQPAQDAPEQPHIVAPRRLQGRLRREGHFGARHAIAHPGHRDRQLLIGQLHRAALRAPAHHGRRRRVASRAYRGPANAATSACNASSTARSPSGISAWIIATVTALASTASPGTGRAGWLGADFLRTVRMGGVLRNEWKSLPGFTL